ncbi:hypothetical protein K466DRAFT_93675 [Polyporus arcularius HHB13444]|uniref:Uncharacterized protein n=1 Tax=Polyporus arcularius HHB13444 TaxID=1314778 RepID=A0A5C3NPL1_9APHY|nr:hypothetical protein K466DRAFT_93675 [Polyporus arcularius HHB13444]
MADMIAFKVRTQLALHPCSPAVRKYLDGSRSKLAELDSVISRSAPEVVVCSLRDAVQPADFDVPYKLGRGAIPQSPGTLRRTAPRPQRIRRQQLTTLLRLGYDSRCLPHREWSRVVVPGSARAASRVADTRLRSRAEACHHSLGQKYRRGLDIRAGHTELGRLCRRRSLSVRESNPLEGPFTLRCLGDSHILVHALGGVRDRMGVAVCDITLASMTRRLRFRREEEHPVEEIVARPVSDGPRNSPVPT